MKLYIADLHFGHRTVIGFDHRPFSDVEEMDNAMISFWNSRVAKEDEVYIIGDFAYKNDKPEEWYLRQLKGYKHLVIGNHDSRMLKNSAAMGYFESVDKMMHVTDGDKQICLCHFPIAEWNGFYRGSWHLYGHIHNRTEGAFQYMKQFDRALNTGACINGYTPASINELIRNNKMFKEKHINL